mmetsp:Transcript_2828/g.10805  ORF Transcript_2828/g.10805 Transcript_2828/m.10805 type:complete len:549 (-) Transcript_2828:708-2354(-)
MQFGTFVCQLCASAHRQLNHHGVRTISSANFSREDVAFLSARGNDKVREALGIAGEPKKERSKCPSDKAFVNSVKEFIHEAYDKKVYASNKNALEAVDEKDTVKSRPRRISFSGAATDKGAKLVPASRRRTTSNASGKSTGSASAQNGGEQSDAAQKQQQKADANFLDDVFTSHENQPANGNQQQQMQQQAPKVDARTDLLSHLDDMFAPMQPQGQQNYYQQPTHNNYSAPYSGGSQYGQDPYGAQGGNPYGGGQQYGAGNPYGGVQQSYGGGPQNGYMGQQTGGSYGSSPNMYQQNIPYQQQNYNSSPYSQPAQGSQYPSSNTARINNPSRNGSGASNPFDDDLFGNGPPSGGASNPFASSNGGVHQTKSPYQQPAPQKDQFSNLVGSFGKVSLSSNGGTQQRNNTTAPPNGNAPHRPPQQQQSIANSNPFSSPAKPSQHSQKSLRPTSKLASAYGSTSSSKSVSNDPFGIEDDFSPVSHQPHQHTSSSQQIRQEAISTVDADAFQFENTWKNQNVTSSDRVREGNTGFSLKPEKSFQQNVGWRQQQ